jgi:nucleoid DNA-binding protein
MPRKATAKKVTKPKKAVASKKTTVRKVTAVRKSAAKPAAKKSTAKKVVAKKAPAKKVVAAKKAVAPKRSTTAISDAYSKSQLLNEIAAETGVARKQVSEVFDSLSNIVERHVKKRGVGQFTLPGLLKVVTTRKPATKARKGTNPFTGEPTVFKAKPARTVVKIRALKKLKDMVV